MSYVPFQINLSQVIEKIRIIRRFRSHSPSDGNRSAFSKLHEYRCHDVRTLVHSTGYASSKEIENTKRTRKGSKQSEYAETEYEMCRTDRKLKISYHVEVRGCCASIFIWVTKADEAEKKGKIGFSL